MTARRLRVAQMVQNLNYGGMERVLADLVRGLDPEQFESHIVVLQYLGRFSQGLEQFATLHQAPPLGRLSMIRPGPLRDLLARIEPDVVHTHSGVWFKGSLAARQAGVPRVFHTEHGRQSPDPWIDRLIDRAASGRSSGVVAVSEVLARQLADRVRVICPVHLIPNGIDTEHYRPESDDGAVRRELGIGPATPIIGSIGRLEPIKGYDVMVRAFAALGRGTASADPPVLIVAGDGSERERLIAITREARIADRVHWLGWRDDPLSLLRAFTLFTMSSRSEGTSISLLEAMSAGKTPVVTEVGGNRAVLGQELFHRLVPPEDPEALAGAWRGALADPVRLARDAAVARGTVVARFGSRAMVEAYADLYRGGARPWSPPVGR